MSSCVTFKAEITPYGGLEQSASNRDTQGSSKGTRDGELRTVYGTELMVVYVELSVKVDTLITVSVTKLVVVRVWSTVIVVGLTFVVFKSSQQYISSGSWKMLQVRTFERVCRWMDIWGKSLLVYPPREASTDVSSKPLLVSL